MVVLEDFEYEILVTSLRDAVAEIEEHHREYHHQTPPEKLKLWKVLTEKGKPLMT
jgi:hypothetical protein